jgi:hypothetical protein
MSNLLCSLALVFVCGSAPLLAVAQPRPSSAGSQSGAAAPQSNGRPPVSIEVALLKAQLEDSRKFQEQLLSTVHWSLGTLATFAALLVGFGWFANFRMYERDKATLERDLRTQLLNELQKASIEASSAAEKRFSEQDSVLESRLREIGDLLKGELTTLVENSERRSASDLRMLRRDVLRLQIASTLQDRESSLVDKLYRNALSKCVSALQFANELDDQYVIGDVLDLISTDISNIINESTKPIDNFLMAKLVDSLDSVKGVHAHAAAGLKAKTPALLVA